ncbi:MAG: serine/threonine protein kinase [Blastocatellia bacterium]
MDQKRWQRIDELLKLTLDLDQSARAAFLDRACDGDAELRHEVEQLLSGEAEAEDFLETPAIISFASQSPETPTASLTGQQIGHYLIESLLGVGGMGEVYLALDTRLERRVALKFLPAQFTADADRLRRFEQEARTASALNHPNIIVIHEIGEEMVESGPLRFIATEYVDGQTLRRRVAEGPLTPGEALEIAIQIADALAAAHQAGIAHRDIKPENIMLRRDGYVKVLDFGLAKLTERPSPEPETQDMAAETTAALSQTATALSAVMGTIGYMSPEQARGLKVDARTDLFSLGVVLYETITGRPPFTGETGFEVAQSIVEEQPPLAPLPDQLRQIVDRALRKEREARYQTATEMGADLKALRDRLKAAAQASVSEAPAPAKTSRVSRSLFIIGIAAALVIAWLGISRLLRPPDRIQVQAQSSASPAPAVEIKNSHSTIPAKCRNVFTLGNLEWCQTSGGGVLRNGEIVLHHTEEPAEAWGNLYSSNLDCVFDVTFDKGKGDSSAGLEIWEDRLEYSLTFRGGSLRVLSKSQLKNEVRVKPYASRRIRIHLKVSPERLYGAIDGRVLINRKNTYWKEPRLKPRLNAHAGDTITLHSCSCSKQ